MTDEALVVAYREGDSRSFEFLMDRYLKSVYSFLARTLGTTHEAEDLTQEVFVRVWRFLPRFDESRRFKTWIFTIAHNVAIDWLKKKKPIPFAAFEGAEGENSLLAVLQDGALSPEASLVRAQSLDDLTKALQALSAYERMFITLRYHEDMTFEEIGAILGEPMNTVKSRHRRTLVALKKSLFLHQNPA